ncbi:uncharacterized protein TNCV_3058921 [Trichonephila clavipes]|nr:uncharacterized protein TNCV_3058921 [Trichonephila clavipes]
MSSNPGEDMDACKCIVSSQHGGTINSRRATSSFVWLVEGEERWEAPGPQGFFPINWGGTEQKRTVTCMVFKAKANDRLDVREVGHSISEEAMKFGFSRTTISRMYREYRESDKTSNLRHRCGRKKNMQERDQRKTNENH